MKAATVAVRLVFTAVFVMNVVCALQFIVDPAAFVGAYQLEGAGAEAAVRGMGIVFLMWNATYPLFIVRPVKQKALGIIILIQQAIGCVGESFVLFALPADADVLAASIMRFTMCDAIGLVLMTLAFVWFFFRARSMRLAKRAVTTE